MTTTWDDPSVPMNGTMKKQMLNHIYSLLTEVDIDVDLINPDLIKAEETKESIDKCIELVGYLIDEGNRGRYS